MGGIRGVFRNIYKLMFRPIYKSLVLEIRNREGDVNYLQHEIAKLQNENIILKEMIGNIKKDVSGINNSVRYFGDTLAEMSYTVRCNSDELKRDMHEMRKLEIRLNNMMNDEGKETKRVHQIVPVFRVGDAIGDYALHIDRVIKESGMESTIYAYQNLSDIKDIRPVEELIANESDIILLHMAAANDFVEIMEAYPAKKVLFYHNITPSEFFHGFDDEAEQSTRTGREQLNKMISVVDSCITDSNYNMEELRQIGYTCPIHVLPIPFEKKNFETMEVLSVKEKITDGKTNLIFVGRIAPNKKIEDVIRCYQVYKEKYNDNSRLILVGGYDPEGKYYQYIQKQINEEDDVIMTGHIHAAEWITYYKNADVFLCMSEHEGFCVPIVEAMSYQIPIVAYSSCAVPETLGEGGILIGDKNMDAFAEAIHRIVTSLEEKENIQKKQVQEMKKYDVTKLVEDLKGCIRMIMEERKDD